MNQENHGSDVPDLLSSLRLKNKFGRAKLVSIFAQIESLTQLARTGVHAVRYHSRKGALCALTGTIEDRTGIF